VTGHDLDLTSASATRGGSQPLGGYLSVPEGAGPWPGVVVIHEAMGLDAQTRRHADRLARAGYLALAVDLFSEGGPRCVVATMRALRRGAGRACVDIVTAQEQLRADPRCTGKVGVIGFCMGGGFALLTAAAGFDAASANYGSLPRDPEAAFDGACPVVGSYGGRDLSLRGAAAALDSALERAEVDHDVKEYHGAGHAFLDDEPPGPAWARPLLRVTGMGPNPEAAVDAWRRIESFFATHLSGARP
jgi:carboxymethylenebutenolidase